MNFGIGWQPHFVVDHGLLEDEIRALRKRCQDPTSDLYVVVEPGFEACDVASLLVYPQNSAEFLHDILGQVFRLVIGIWPEIENDHFLAAEEFAPRICKALGAEKIGNLSLLFFILLSLFFGIVVEFGFLFLLLVEVLAEAIVFFLLFIAFERLAVLGEQMADFIISDVKNIVFLDRVRSHLAVRVSFFLFLGQMAGVLLEDFIHGFLIFIDVEQQLGDIRQWPVFRAWKIENGVLNGRIYFGPGHSDLINVAAAVQLNTIGLQDSAYRLVVEIVDFFRSFCSRRASRL